MTSRSSPLRVLPLLVGGMLSLRVLACDEPTPSGPSVPEPDGGASIDASADVVLDTPDALVPRGGRTLGVQVDLGDENLLARVRAAKAARASTTVIAFGWDDVEVPFDGGADASTALYQPALHIANLVLSAEDVGLVLVLDAVDTGGSRAPADLAGRPLDDPSLVARFEKLEDYAFAQLGDVRVDALFVGSDVTRALGTEDAAYGALARFVERVKAHARTLAPNVPVGFVVSDVGARVERARLQAAWLASDVVGVDYLATDPALTTAASPDAVDDALRETLAGLPDRPVVVRGLAYPTAGSVSGSPTSQARFVERAFAAWDEHATKIPLAVFVELDDAPAVVVDARAVRQGRNDEAFRAIVGALGLRDEAGRPKPAYDALTRQATARGF